MFENEMIPSRWYISRQGERQAKALDTNTCCDSGRKHKDAQTNTRMKSEKDKKRSVTGGRDRMHHHPLTRGNAETAWQQEEEAKRKNGNGQ